MERFSFLRKLRNILLGLAYPQLVSGFKITIFPSIERRFISRLRGVEDLETYVALSSRSTLWMTL